MEDMLALDGVAEQPANGASDGGGAGETTARAAQSSDSFDDGGGPFTPAKRRRKESPSGSAVVPASPFEGAGGIVKEELDDGDGEQDRRSTTSNQSNDASTAQPGEQKSKSCNGCYRFMDVSRDWVNPDQVMAWAYPNGRGYWCRDCLNLWRLNHSDMSLLLFSQWLKRDENWAKWELDQLGYISLMVEGCSRISVDQLAQRVRTLQWLSAHACVPLRLSSVVPLSEYMTDPTSAKDADPRMLTTMMVGGSARLAMQVPRARSENGVLIERPTTRGESVLSSRRWLLTQNDDDLDLVTRLFDGEGECKVQQPQVKVDDDQDTGTPGKTRLSRGVMALAGTFEGLFKRFAENEWESIKESSFTNPYNKMAALQVQAEGKGDSTTIKVAQMWCKGISAAKSFLARHRDFAKAKSRNGRLVDLWPSLEELSDFLENSVKMRPAPSLGLLRYKVLFWRSFAESQQIAKATAVLTSEGFLTLVKGLPARGQQELCFDAWLRALVLSAAAERLNETNQDVWEEDVKIHEKDCTTALDELRKDSVLEKVCKPSLDDFYQYIVILRSASEPDGVQAQALSDALDRLNDPCMSVLKQALYNGTGAGKHIISAASCLMQVSAKDSVADAKRAEAFKFLDDENLPSIARAEEAADDLDCQSELTAVVSNFKVLSDMSAVDMLDESLRCMSESLDLWSKVRLEQSAPSVQKWLEQLDSHVRFFDEVLCLFLSGITMHPSVKMLFEVSPEANDKFEETGAVDPAPTVDALVAFKGFVSKYAIDEHPLSSFLDRYKKAVHTIDNAFKGLVSTDSTKELIEDGVQNYNARAAVYTLFSAMSKLDCMPATAKEAVDEWMAKKEIGADKDSFLTRAAELVSKLDALKSYDFLLRAEDLECTLRLDEVDGVFSLTGNYNMAKRLCGDLLNMPVIPHVKALMFGAVQEAFGTFVGSLYLGSLKLDARSALTDAGSIGLPASLDALVDRHTLGDGIKYATKVFAAAGKVLPWSQQTLADLVAALLQALPDGTNVSVLRLCRPTMVDESELSFMEKGDIVKVCNLFSKVSQLVITIGFIREKCFGGEVVHKMHKVKPELAAAVSMAKGLAEKLLNELGQSFAQSPKMRCVPWLVGFASMKEWVSLVSDQLPVIGGDLLARTLTSVVSLSAELESVTPRHEHCVSDSNFNQTLASRHLLKWPSRPTLNEKTTLLFGALKDLQRLQSLWALAPTLQDRDDTKDQVTVADSRYRSARTAITIIVAVDVVLNKSGDDQRASAEVLVNSKADTIPKPLLSELSKLVRKQPASSKTT